MECMKCKKDKDKEEFYYDKAQPNRDFCNYYCIICSKSVSKIHRDIKRKIKIYKETHRNEIIAFISRCEKDRWVDLRDLNQIITYYQETNTKLDDDVKLGDMYEKIKKDFYDNRI